MKKVVFIILVVMFVLLTSNNSALADDDTIQSTIQGVNDIRLLKTDKECRKIGGSLIPSDAERSVLEVDMAEASVQIPPGAYWLFGKGEDFQIITLPGLSFLSISGGFYVLYYKVPKESPSAVEFVRPAKLIRL